MSFYSTDPEPSIPLPLPGRTRTKRRRRTPNWRSSSTPATLAKQAAIRELLATGLSFTVAAIGDALGISRQLALYHTKKMAATKQLVMVLEAAPVGSGLRYRVWDETALMAHYLATGVELGVVRRAA